MRPAFKGCSGRPESLIQCGYTARIIDTRDYTVRKQNWENRIGKTGSGKQDWENRIGKIESRKQDRENRIGKTESKKGS